MRPNRSLQTLNIEKEREPVFLPRIEKKSSYGNDAENKLNFLGKSQKFGSMKDFRDTQKDPGITLPQDLLDSLSPSERVRYMVCYINYF